LPSPPTDGKECARSTQGEMRVAPAGMSSPRSRKTMSSWGDYIPANGFIYRPDLVWPPPPDPRNAIEQVLVGEEYICRAPYFGQICRARIECPQPKD
jgi:hypothetical protein